VALIRRDQDQLVVVRSIFVGDEPRSISVSKTRRRAYVAIGGEDAVAVLDLDRLVSSDETANSALIDRIAVGGVPRTLVVSPDERWLVTCCSVPCEVFVHDAETLTLVSSRKIFDGGFNPGIPAVTQDSKIVIVPSAVNRALSKLLLPDGEPSDQKQLGLDIRGKAVGDANSAALSPDNQFLVVTCGGTHELLVLEFPTIDWPKGDPGDFLPEPLKKDPSRFRRIKLGGRPVDVQFFDQRQVVIANYLDDSLQLVDIETNQVKNSISLGGPRELDAIRRGEIVFYDADRSLHSWFSCHTCHIDGHTSAQVFDTRNDQSYGTPKLTPSLRGVVETGPWTWHGWQTDLKDAMKKSLQESMNTEHSISKDDVESLLAYLGTVNHPENPRSDSSSPSIDRGRQLFAGKAGCIKCHTQPTFTSTETFDGAVEDPKDRNKLYNPPSLRGVSTRRRFLHTGKAKSLEQVLTKYHRPEDLVGETLNEEEIAALVEFLKTL
jgi:cytochrome c peroxidase